MVKKKAVLFSKLLLLPLLIPWYCYNSFDKILFSVRVSGIEFLWVVHAWAPHWSQDCCLSDIFHVLHWSVTQGWLRSPCFLLLVLGSGVQGLH